MVVCTLPYKHLKWGWVGRSSQSCPRGAKDLLAGAGVLQDADWTGQAAQAADTYLPAHISSI